MTEEKDNLRSQVRTICKQKKDGDFGSRQNDPEESFLTDKRLKEFNLLVPPLDPATLYSVVENSSTLASCIEAYIDNIDGFGYEFFYTGTKETEKNKEVLEEQQELSDFFKQVNENQSFIELRKELRRDYETTGNGYIEVIRYMDNEIATLYRADSKYMRLQVKQEEPVEVKIPLMRKGKIRQTPVNKKFRKFAMGTKGGRYEVRWFKEYGDPRRMCAITGEYEETLKKQNKEIQEPASEILHFKQGNGIYGIPRWAGVIPVVRGLYKADFVNYDLFENQAVPPLAILVSGGQLTKQSWEDVVEMLEGLKGSENFHKALVLESEGATGDNVGDKPTSASVDFKPLNQRDDLLFGNYIDSSEKRVRAKFRLPAFYLGITSEHSRASADASKMLAEEQVFRPERDSFDEIINFTLIGELNAVYWKFKTIGPRLIEGVTIIDAIGKFARAGALSTNYAIKLMNRVLDLDMPTYDDDGWSDIPVAVLLELIKKKQVTEIDGVGYSNDNIPAKEIKEATENLNETIKNPELDSISDDLSDLKEQIDELFSLVREWA